MKRKHVAIGIIIFILSLFVGFWGYADSYITALSVSGNLPHSLTTDVPLVSGNTFHTEFFSPYDSLGTVKLRMRGFNRINTNTLVFRLREKGQNDWHVINTYKTDRFPDGGTYPFGFPIIENSHGKIYEIELSTTDGTKENGIGIISGEGNLQSQYLYSRGALLKDKHLLVWFMGEKMKELLFSWPHVLYWSMILSPAIILAIDTKKMKRFLSQIPFMLLVYVILVYALDPMEIHSNIILFIGAGVGIVSLRKKQPHWPFIIGIIGIIGVIITEATGAMVEATRFSNVVFISLVTGMFLMLISQHKGKRQS